MKGTFFQRPLEFKLQVDGESWRQGDAIAGELTVKNHGNEAVSLADMHVDLAHGKLRDVRAKDPEAFEILTSQKFDAAATVAPQGEASMSWKFQTDRNCPITDNTSSLFVLYGRGAATEQMGQLQLPVQPYAVIDDFLKAVTIHQRFVVKAHRASKNGVEIKLAPPDSKAFASLENLLLYFRFEGDTLNLKYVFKTKKLEATAASFDVKKQVKDFEQVFERNDYYLPSGRANHERIEAAIEAGVNQGANRVF